MTSPTVPCPPAGVVCRRGAAYALAASLLVASTIGGCPTPGDSSDSQSDHRNPVVVTIGAAGGSLQVSDSASPLRGIQIIVAPGVLSQDTPIKLAPATEEPTLPAFPDKTRAASETFMVDLGQAPLTAWIELRIPAPVFDPAAGEFPVFLLVNTKTGEIEPLTPVGVDSETGAFRFAVQTSGTVIATIVTPSRTNASAKQGTWRPALSEFDRDRDAFRHLNSASIHGSGACYGFAVFSRWYWLNRRSTSHSLAAAFSDADEISVVADTFELQSNLFRASETLLAEILRGMISSVPGVWDALVLGQLYAEVNVLDRPAVLGLWVPGGLLTTVLDCVQHPDECGDYRAYAHAVLVVSMSNGQLAIYDSNYSGIRHISYGITGIDDYSSGGTTFSGYTVISSYTTSGLFAGDVEDIFDNYSGREMEYPNDQPTVNAGPDQAVVEGSLVSLSGSASDDDIDDPTTRWEGNVTFADAGALQTTFVAPQVNGVQTITLTLRATDSRGKSVTDNVRITVNDGGGILVPDVPSGPSPVDRATGVSVNADLDWADAARATAYDVYFGTTNPPPLVDEDVTASNWPLATLAYGTTFYWKVVAKNSAGPSAGPVWRFTVESQELQPPDVPSTPTPADGAPAASIDADLDWADAARATAYDVYFGTTNPPPLVDENITASNWPLATLAHGTTFYWKIVAKNTAGETAGSVWWFTTAPDGAVINVPYDYANIQAAIDAADTSDLVLVANGTYSGPGNYALNFGGKDIWLRSAGGPDECVIDCAGQGNALSFGNGETPAARVEGFTIQNASGSAVSIGYASPTFSDCVFRDNDAGDGYGGAVNILHGSPEFRDCAFVSNAAYFGGAVYVKGQTVPTQPRFVNCCFYDNSANTAVMWSRYATAHVTVINCTFAYNETYYSPGGIYVQHNAGLTVKNSVLYYNQGAEILTWYASATVVDSCVDGGSGSNVITDAPQFVDGPGRDLRLSPLSPCVNSGNNGHLPSWATMDLDGNPRIQSGVVDMGAYESPY